MLGIKPLFKTVYRKLCGRLSIKPVCKELAHPGCWNVDCDLLAVPNSRPPDPLQEGRQRISWFVQRTSLVFWSTWTKSYLIKKSRSDESIERFSMDGNSSSMNNVYLNFLIYSIYATSDFFIKLKSSCVVVIFFPSESKRRRSADLVLFSCGSLKSSSGALAWILLHSSR